MKKSIITMCIAMLTSSMVFANGYGRGYRSNNYRKVGVKKQRRAVHRGPVVKNRKVYRGPVVRSKTVYRTPAFKNRKVYRRPVVRSKTVYRTPAFKNRKVYRGPVYRKPIFNNRRVHHAPVARVNVFTVQFSGFGRTQRKQLAALLARRYGWGTASVSRNFFTGTYTVTIRSTWSRARALRSLQQSLYQSGISTNFNGSYFAPVGAPC